MSALNYHHLRYFWAIAHERSLTRAAARLHVSQSALSIQLRKLEERLGQRLFDRSNRALVLTEAGKVALDYADSIFEAGDELVGTLKAQHTSQQSVLRVGAVATLSRNFQIDLLRPLLGKASLEIVVRSGSLRELLSQLRNHELDLVLSNQAVKADAHDQWHAHLLDRQPVVLVSKPVRAGFDRIADPAGVSVRIAAEVDDMAMLRLLAREHRGLSLVPRIVVQDELREGRLRERFRVPDLDESFFAITQTRRFPNKLVRELLA
jgi:LysR family transcriptional regulator, transcriptional activator of nhaA